MHFGLLHWNGWEPQPNETAGPMFFFFQILASTVPFAKSQVEKMYRNLIYQLSIQIMFSIQCLTLVYLNHAKRFRYDLVLLVKLFGVLFGFCENTICFRK